MPKFNFLYVFLLVMMVGLWPVAAVIAWFRQRSVILCSSVSFALSMMLGLMAILLTGGTDKELPLIGAAVGSFIGVVFALIPGRRKQGINGRSGVGGHVSQVDAPGRCRHCGRG